MWVTESNIFAQILNNLGQAGKKPEDKRIQEVFSALPPSTADGLNRTIAPEMADQTFHDNVEHRGDVESEELREHQPADDGDTEWPACFCSRAITCLLYTSPSPRDS